jgi:hypothetical protein
MGIPEGMDLDLKQFILKLCQSLYGLKQVPRIWWERMYSFLMQIGFYCCDAEPSIYICNHNENFIILLLFVDDILLTGNSDNAIDEFVRECTSKFKARDLSIPKLFLGTHISYCDSKVILH